MDTEKLRTIILEEAQSKGLTLTEDELNTKILEAGRMDPDKLERLNGGGGLFNCDLDNLCWKEYLCIELYK